MTDQTPGPGGRSGYTLYFHIAPGGGRRDCTFVYGTLEQIFFLLRQEFMPAKAKHLELAIVFCCDETIELTATDDHTSKVLDLRPFITAKFRGEHSTLGDRGFEQFWLAIPYDERLKISFDIDFAGIEQALPRLTGAPLQPGEELDGDTYGYRTGEDWIFPYGEEPPPPRRVKSRTGYVLWGSAHNGRFPELGQIRKLLRAARLTRGASLARGFPRAAFFAITDDFPAGRDLSDNPVAGGLSVISRRLRDALKPLLGGSKVEFLPVRVKREQFYDKGQFYVLNPIDLLDVIDARASGGTFDPKEKSQLRSITRPLVLKPVDPEAVMFRPKSWRRHIFVRADVAAALEQGRFTQLDFAPLSALE